MKNLIIIFFLALISTVSNADVIGLYQGDNGTQIDFEVLTYTRGISVDARLDPSVDSRKSAFQSVRMTASQYRDLFESDKEVKAMELSGSFDSVADAVSNGDERLITITETFTSDGGVLVTEKILTVEILNKEITSIKLQTRKRRGLLGIVPLWMAKVFSEKIEVTKVEDGLLLKDDGHDFCRVTNDEAIDQGALGGSSSELYKICQQN